MHRKANDLLMWVGEKYYPAPQDFTNEVLDQGMSKRVALTKPPEGIVAGCSRVFLIHPKASVAVKEGKTLDDLRQALARGASEEILELLGEAWDKNPAWCVSMIIEKAKTVPRQRFRTETREILIRLASETLNSFETRLVPGVFAYCYLTGIQYVCKKDETEVPKELQEIGIEAVRIVYKEKTDD